MKDTVSKFNSDVLNLSRKMRDKASELRKEDLLVDFLKQLGFEHDWGFWRYSGEKNSLSLMVINDYIEIDLCMGNNNRFSLGRMFEFIAGSLYTNTITDGNIETVKEDIKNIVDNFKKQETPDYLINRLPFLNDYDLVVTFTNTDVDMFECMKNVKLPATDKRFILFDTAIYGGFCGERFLVKYVSNGEVYDEILALSVTEEDSFVFGYTEVDGNRIIHGDYNLVKHLNWLLRKLKDSDFFQCETTNLDSIIANVNCLDTEFKYPEYVVTRF
jgi:hypothetical protein